MSAKEDPGKTWTHDEVMTLSYGQTVASKKSLKKQLALPELINIKITC